MTLERRTSQPGSTIKPDALSDFPLFADFSDRELRRLLRLMRRWDLPQGTVVVSEGGPGGSCFIIISGSVDVTVRVRSRQQLNSRRQHLRSGQPHQRRGAHRDVFDAQRRDHP